MATWQSHRRKIACGAIQTSHGITFMTKKIAVVIVAAGSGSRFGDPIPKQYHLLGAKTLLRHCIESFAKYVPSELIRVIYNPDHQDLYDNSVKGLS
jgi:2-C-methyl-D-erythritol 4-phosphate cytidylyltransferase/2-C-methyl-D-erythritol 2,4-cyclodiphosphate synthase